MRGYPQHNFPAFDAVRDGLAADGHNVTSPADMSRHLWAKRGQSDREFDDDYVPDNDELLDFMGNDLDAIRRCDAVYMLPGWEHSRGAAVEKAFAEYLGIDVMYHEDAVRQVTRNMRPAATDFAEACDAAQHPSSQSFLRVLAEAAKLHAKKSHDYGTDDDPFANVRASEEFGVPAWVGCVMRATDKVRRLQAFAKKGRLANESALDSAVDNVVYFAIAAVLMREIDSASVDPGASVASDSGACERCVG